MRCPCRWTKPTTTCFPDEGVDAGSRAVRAGALRPQSRIGIVWDKPVGEQGKPLPDKKLKASRISCTKCRRCGLSLRFPNGARAYTADGHSAWSRA